MELTQDKFLDSTRTRIMCHAHAAYFEVATGLCTEGPCEGESLVAVPHRIEDGMVIVAGDLPTTPRDENDL